MTALFSLFGSVIASIVAFLVERFGAKIAIRLAVVAAWVSGRLAFTLGINSLINGIAVSVPGWIQSGFSLLPSNTGACIAAITAAHTAAFVYLQVTTITAIKGRI